jgi:hypothetical protein
VAFNYNTYNLTKLVFVEGIKEKGKVAYKVDITTQEYTDAYGEGYKMHVSTGAPVGIYSSKATAVAKAKATAKKLYGKQTKDVYIRIVNCGGHNKEYQLMPNGTFRNTV